MDPSRCIEDLGLSIEVLGATSIDMNMGVGVSNLVLIDLGGCEGFGVRLDGPETWDSSMVSRNGLG